jgi:two-component sensor histidine kinase
VTPPVRVLYVDDDAGLARLVQKTLEPRGYLFEHVASANAAIARLSEGGIDVVALDHHMPDQTGLDVLPQIVALPDAPPVVYVTGSEDSRVAVAALKAGAADYVWKDLQGQFRELMAQSIEGALRQNQLRLAKEKAEREVRLALERAEMLLHEVNHRVANSLALVASLTRLQRNAVSDPSAKNALDEMQVRIAAIAGVHRRLYTSADVSFVELDTYLAGLVEELESAMRALGRDHAIILAAEPITLATDKAVSLGIIVTELVTNAFKYAYPGDARGDIRVKLIRLDGHAVLTVEDDGVGWAGQGPASGTGLGSRIITATAAMLQSHVAFVPRETGTCAELKFAI